MYTNMTLDVDMQKHGRTRTPSGIPLWALTELGNQVKLYRPYDEFGDGYKIHKIYTQGKLDAIQSEQGDGRGACALIELEDGDLVRIPFDYLEK